MLRHQVVWEKCSFTNPKTDKEIILKRGELLPDWVTDFTLAALVGAGGIKAIEQAEPTPEPEPQLPPVLSRDTGLDLQTASITLAPAKPAPNANKPEWVAYAVSQRAEGVSEEDARVKAEAMSKAELAAKYGNGN